jgi:hypothetical protein
MLPRARIVFPAAITAALPPLLPPGIRENCHRIFDPQVRICPHSDKTIFPTGMPSKLLNFLPVFRRMSDWTASFLAFPSSKEMKAFRFPSIDLVLSITAFANSADVRSPESNRLFNADAEWEEFDYPWFLLFHNFWRDDLIISPFRSIFYGSFYVKWSSSFILSENIIERECVGR